MRNKILGSWELASFDITTPENITRPWGKNTRGLLIYSETGHVSVAINRDVVSTGNSDKDQFDAILFYAGMFSVDDNRIHHQVTLASSPSRVGKDMLRYAELKGDLLQLTTPKEAYGIATLTWKKIHA